MSTARRLDLVPEPVIGDGPSNDAASPLSRPPLGPESRPGVGTVRVSRGPRLADGVTSRGSSHGTWLALMMTFGVRAARCDAFDHLGNGETEALGSESRQARQRRRPGSTPFEETPGLGSALQGAARERRFGTARYATAGAASAAVSAAAAAAAAACSRRFGNAEGTRSLRETAVSLTLTLTKRETPGSPMVTP